jgi:uncharacterized membrane protein
MPVNARSITYFEINKLGHFLIHQKMSNVTTTIKIKPVIENRCLFLVFGEGLRDGVNMR